MSNRVGPVLEKGPVTMAVVHAIKAQNPEAEIIDRESYLRVLSPHHCTLDASLVETLLGRPFALPDDLEIIMTSFAGELQIDSDKCVWKETLQ